MKKWTKILLIIVIVILLLLVGMSYFIGTQVFMGSTQLVASMDKGIHNKTTKYGLPTY